MPKLDDRLIAVTKRIRSTTHVDIGSDHAGLLVSLLKSGRIEKGIAVENKLQPFRNSSQSLQGLNAETRFGDGLAVLYPNEADSLSICGMGADSIVRILESYPDRIPPNVVIQSNFKPELVRAWAFENGYHIQDEHMTEGQRSFLIMAFQRSEKESGSDPAYEGLDFGAAMLFGPLLMKSRDSIFVNKLREEETYWSQLARLGQLEPRRASRLELIRKVLSQDISVH